MLDKSPEQVLDNDLMQIQDEFAAKIPSIILCSEPFEKAEFLNRLIGSIKCPVIFIDMDLLYTGYVKSGMIQAEKSVTVVHPDKNSWKKELAGVINRASTEKSWS